MKFPNSVEQLARKLIRHCQKEIGFAADRHAVQAWSALVHQAELNLADVQGGLQGADVRVQKLADDLKVSA